MKKFLKVISVTLIIFSLTMTFWACDDKSKNSIDATQYVITVNESKYYNVNGQTTKASAGVEAYVTITPKFDAVVIDKVLYNGQQCTENPNQQDKYTFIMPNTNVDITVEYSFIDNFTDNFLSWDNENENSFTIFTETSNDTYFAQFDDGRLTANVINSPKNSGGYFTSHKESVFSTNQYVVPNNALSVNVTNASSSNSATSFTVKINRTQISAGTTQIVLLVENGHKFGDASLLVCSIIVENA